MHFDRVSNGLAWVIPHSIWSGTTNHVYRLNDVGDRIDPIEIQVKHSSYRLNDLSDSADPHLNEQTSCGHLNDWVFQSHSTWSEEANRVCLPSVWVCLIYPI
jgi:hypothetical protein